MEKVMRGRKTGRQWKCANQCPITCYNGKVLTPCLCLYVWLFVFMCVVWLSRRVHSRNFGFSLSSSPSSIPLSRLLHILLNSIKLTCWALWPIFHSPHYSWIIVGLQFYWLTAKIQIISKQISEKKLCDYVCTAKTKTSNQMFLKMLCQEHLRLQKPLLKPLQ